MSTIRETAGACLRTFQTVKSALDVGSDAFRELIEPRTLNDELGRFRVFCANLGVLQKGHSSIDYRLKDSPLLQQNLSKLLDELQANLVEVDAVLSASRLPYDQQQVTRDELPEDSVSETSSDSSDSDDESETAPELSYRFSEVVDIIDNLYKLSIRIRSPTLNTRGSRAAYFKQIDKATNVDVISRYAVFDRQHTIETVRYLRDPKREASPEGLETDFMVDRLSTAITKRRQHFKYWRKHREKLAASSASEVPVEPIPQAPEPAHEVAQLQSEPLQTAEQQKTLDVPVSEYNPKTLLSGTEATQHHKTLDDALETQTVTSIATTARDLEGQSITLAPPPQAANSGRDFECPYCFIICPSRYGRSRRWRTHLLQDLQPYVCTYKDCSMPSQLFRTRREWLEHERSAHRKVWRCPLHSNSIHLSGKAMETHFQEEHSEVPAGPQMQSLLRAAETSTEDDRRVCPICLADPTVVGGFVNHVANHLERFAAFSLPKDADGSDDSRAGGSNQASQGHVSESLGSTSRSTDVSATGDSHISSDEKLEAEIRQAMIRHALSGDPIDPIAASQIHDRVATLKLKFGKIDLQQWESVMLQIFATLGDLLEAVGYGSRPNPSTSKAVIFKAVLEELGKLSTTLHACIEEDEASVQATNLQAVAAQRFSSSNRKLKQFTSLLLSSDIAAMGDTVDELSSLISNIRTQSAAVSLIYLNLSTLVVPLEQHVVEVALKNPANAKEIAQRFLEKLNDIQQKLRNSNPSRSRNKELSDELGRFVAQLMVFYPQDLSEDTLWASSRKGTLETQDLTNSSLLTLPDSSDQKMDILMGMEPAASNDKESRSGTHPESSTAYQTGGRVPLTETEPEFDELQPHRKKLAALPQPIDQAEIPTIRWLYAHNVLHRDSSGNSPSNNMLNGKIGFSTASILALKVDAIISPVERKLTPGNAALSVKIHAAAGREFTEMCRSVGSIRTGEVRITDAYRLHCRKVIHASRPAYEGLGGTCQQDLRDCYRRSLETAALHDVTSIAFPALSTGGYQFPSNDAARLALEETRSFLEGPKGEKLKLVVFCCIQPKDRDAYGRLFPKYFPPAEKPLWGPDSEEPFPTPENLFSPEKTSSILKFPGPKPVVLLKDTLGAQACAVGLLHTESLITMLLLVHVLAHQNYIDAAKRVALEAFISLEKPSGIRIALKKAFACRLAYLSWVTSKEDSSAAKEFARSAMNLSRNDVTSIDYQLPKLLYVYISHKPDLLQGGNVEKVTEAGEDLRHAMNRVLHHEYQQIRSERESFSPTSFGSFGRGERDLSPIRYEQTLPALMDRVRRSLIKRHIERNAEQLSRRPRSSTAAANAADKLSLSMLRLAQKDYDEAAELNANAKLHYDALLSSAKVQVEHNLNIGTTVWLLEFLSKDGLWMGYPYAGAKEPVAQPQQSPSWSDKALRFISLSRGRGRRDSEESLSGRPPKDNAPAQEQ